MTHIPQSLRKAFEETDKEIDAYFDDVLRNCLFFVRGEITEEEMKHKNTKLNKEGLDLILSFITNREEEVRRGLLKKVEHILGSHENPHTPSNCRLCKVHALSQEDKREEK